MKGGNSTTLSVFLAFYSWKEKWQDKYILLEQCPPSARRQQRPSQWHPGCGMDEENKFELDVRIQGPYSAFMTRKGPNPLLFVALSLSSFAIFFVVIKHRENTNPASLNPRQADHPLVPPRHH